MRIGLALFALTLPAQAINWEGHDDWLADQPAAQEYEQSLKGTAAPQLKAVKPKPCQPRGTAAALPENPYEPVPQLCPEIPR